MGHSDILTCEYLPTFRKACSSYRQICTVKHSPVTQTEDRGNKSFSKIPYAFTNHHVEPSLTELREEPESRNLHYVYIHLYRKHRVPFMTAGSFNQRVLIPFRRIHFQTFRRFSDRASARCQNTSCTYELPTLSQSAAANLKPLALGIRHIKLSLHVP